MVTRSRASVADSAFDAFNAAVLLAFTALAAYPLVYVLSASFSSAEAVMRGAVWLLPVEPSVEGYRAVFRNGDVITGYLNSGFYMTAGTALNVAITLMAGYALAQPDLPFRKILMLFFTFTLLFSGGIIPLYLVTKATIGVNNRLDMLLPNAISIANLIITRTFMKENLPQELRESAKMDGAGDLRYFFSVAVPLSGPIIGVLTMLYALAHWNSFFYAFIFLQDRGLLPLQIVLRNILIMNEVASESFQDIAYAVKLAGMGDLLKFSLIVVSSLPVLAVYSFVQRYFVKGILVGSLKG